MLIIVRGAKDQPKLRTVDPEPVWNASSAFHRNKIKDKISNRIIKEFDLDDFVEKLSIDYKEELKNNLIACDFVKNYVTKQTYFFIKKNRFEFNNEQRYLLRFIKDEDKRMVSMRAEAYLEGKIKRQLNLYI